MNDQSTDGRSVEQYNVIGMSFDPRVLLKQKFSKRIRLLSLIPITLAVLALASWSYYQLTYAYGAIQYSTGGQTYSLRFTKAAKTSDINGVTYADGYTLHDFRKVAVVIRPTDDIYSAHLSCSSIGSAWHQASYEKVSGQTVPICTENQTVFEMIFPNNAKDFLAEIISVNGKATINSDTVNTVFGSIVVK